jgi:hypothetical protein
MANQDGRGDDPCMVAGIRAVDERDDGLVELEISVACGPNSPWTDQPGHHPWFMRFSNRVLVARGPGSTSVFGPDGRVRLAVPRSEIEDFVRAVRQAARDTDADYQALHAQRREQAERERQAEPGKRARLAQDQTRIDLVLAEPEL